MRVLCLHGYHQSGSLLQKKTGAFRKIVKQSCKDFHFIDAPMNHSVNDDGVPTFKWYEIPEGEVHFQSPNYIGWEDSIDYLRTVFQEQGPFDGVLGFSQGGIILSTLCGLRDDIFDFKFAIIASACPVVPEETRALYNNIPSDFPMLFMYGERDDLIIPERSEQLLELLPNKENITVYKHKGGHYIPTTSDSKVVYRKFFSDMKNLC
eukprot:TRINITY_DN4108_c0_g1_i1.p1 TRINITY_DN4108_c0_g1~~TRINITY_DN4108_c0_g1_i1.p1  ORF type:complete len:207 (+),score=36.18 TRINITY_DN4108_c0_g1_i1:241-861(+)